MKLSLQLYQEVQKPCIFFEGDENYHVLKIQLLCDVRLLYKKGIPVDSNMIQKVQSHYMTT